MSAIALVYMVSMPFTSKRYSEKWRYYAWLVIVIGLIIPFRPQLNNAIIVLEVPTYYAQIAQIDRVTAVYFAETEAERLQQNLTVPYITNITRPNILWWQVVFAIWLTGVVVFFVYHAIKHFHFMKMVRRWSKKITDKQILSLYEDIKSEMGITKHIPLYLCPFGSPMMINFIKPQIFLPTKNLPTDDFCFILKHELVHYRRKDLLYKYLIMAAIAIHWFNPIVYLIARAINALCETSCDAEVVQNADIETRQSYSEALIGVVKYQSKLKTALSTNFYGGKKGVKNRISSIMDTRRKKAGMIIACLTIVFTICTGFVFAATPTITRSNEMAANDEWIPINALPTYMIECTNRAFTMSDSTVTMAKGQEETISQTSNLSFEEAAIIAANAVYQEFGFCINGMDGYMGFMAWSYQPVWFGAIVSQELTPHSDGDELFVFTIEDLTGNVLSVKMNTVELPFLG